MPTEIRYSSETARLVAARNEALRRVAELEQHAAVWWSATSGRAQNGSASRVPPAASPGLRIWRAPETDPSRLDA
jgi:hypothetical protein